MKKLFARCAVTAIKLPFAMAWDVMSLGNMGDGASTTRVLRQHQARAEFDEVMDVIEEVAAAQKRIDKEAA